MNKNLFSYVFVGFVVFLIVVTPVKAVSISGSTTLTQPSAAVIQDSNSASLSSSTMQPVATDATMSDDFEKTMQPVATDATMSDDFGITKKNAKQPVAKGKNVSDGSNGKPANINGSNCSVSTKNDRTSLK